MSIENLLLTKEEVPIISGSHFIIPIHPMLLRKDMVIDKNLAYSVFPQAAEEWYTELTEYVSTLENGKEKTWINDVFLKGKPEVKEERGRLTVYPLKFWQALVETMENGFATVLSINRNVGGSLFLPPDDKKQHISPVIVKFSPEKFKAYEAEDIGLDSSLGAYSYAYDQHNIDNYQGALFLRNWAMLYVNEALKTCHLD